MRQLANVFALFLLFAAVSCSSPTQPPATQPPAQPGATTPAATAGAAVATATITAPAAGPTLPPTAAGTATPAPSSTLATTATADPAIAGGLVGLWQGNNNSYYLFNKDGTWNWDQKSDRVLTNPENQGRWWLEGDVVHIQDLSGLAPCPLNQIGTYQAQLSGDTLELAAVTDPCTVRIGQTSGTYARQAAGP